MVRELFARLMAEPACALAVPSFLVDDDLSAAIRPLEGWAECGRTAPEIRPDLEGALDEGVVEPVGPTRPDFLLDGREEAAPSPVAPAAPETRLTTAARHKLAAISIPCVASLCVTMRNNGWPKKLESTLQTPPLQRATAQVAGLSHQSRHGPRKRYAPPSPPGP